MTRWFAGPLTGSARGQASRSSWTRTEMLASELYTMDDLAWWIGLVIAVLGALLTYVNRRRG